MTGNESTRLYYHGTQTEVLLGDRVSMASALRRKLRAGAVTFIPERTARERALEAKEPEDWHIGMDDGTTTGWIYSPEDLQPSRRLSFVRRGDPAIKGVTITEIEQRDREAEANATWGELILVALFKMLVLLGAIALVWYVARQFS